MSKEVAKGIVDTIDQQLMEADVYPYITDKFILFVAKDGGGCLMTGLAGAQLLIESTYAALKIIGEEDPGTLQGLFELALKDLIDNEKRVVH